MTLFRVNTLFSTDFQRFFRQRSEQILTVAAYLSASY